MDYVVNERYKMPLSRAMHMDGTASTSRSTSLSLS